MADRCTLHSSFASIAYYGTTGLVLIGVSMGHHLLSPSLSHPASQLHGDFVHRFSNWDGLWYLRITNEGYTHDPWRMSPVAYFPAYPALATIVKRVTGCRTEWALLIVSHAALLGCFCLFGRYVAERFPESAIDLPEYSLLALGLFPTTFWMRMCYTESLFLFTVLLAMFGMERGWRPLWIALVIGFATATRSTGVALLPVFWWWLWNRLPACRRVEGRLETCPTRSGTALQAIMLLPICVWGLLAYMTFLYLSFGDALAFMQTQRHWDERTLAGIGDKLWKLATLEPFWSVYVPSSPCYWGRVPPHDNPLFNLKFWNPIYVLLTIGFLVVGAWKKWLNARELILAIGLLSIALWFQATRACMMSQARYASVIFPVYIVMGQILTRLPRPLVGMLCAISGLMLGTYTALFVSWYWFY